MIGRWQRNGPQLQPKLSGEFTSLSDFIYSIKSKTMNQKVALITGITGQDRAYLAELLLGKEYVVHGIRRRTSLLSADRIDHLYQDSHLPNTRLFLHYGDMVDATSLLQIIQEVQPDEIYSMVAQSNVHVSFEELEYKVNSDFLGPLRILEPICLLGLQKKTRFYQAGTSELYSFVQKIPQRESAPFYPRSPLYSVVKLYACWIAVNSVSLMARTLATALYSITSPRCSEKPS